MLGYMTPEQAVDQGLTHHGKYFGIPVYLAVHGRDGLDVAVKWAPMDILLELAMCIEQGLRWMFFADDEPGFQFWVGPTL